MLTIHDLNAYFNAGNSVYKTIEWAEEQLIRPAKPSKPELPPVHSSQEVETYASELKKYEQEFSIYDKKFQEYRENYRHLNDSIADFIKNESGLYTIPDTSQDKVWQKAREDGEGWAGVYDKLVGLVDLFNP